MRQWGQIQYRPGARWRCKSERGDFHFVIIGPGSKPDRKRCRLDYDIPSASSHGIEQEYTHRHLKKYGRYVSCDEGDK